MAGLLWFTEKISRLMSIIAYSALTFIMLLTVADVTGRIFRHPILGTFEIVGMGGAIAIGFAIPLTSWLRGQTYVDFVIQMISGLGKEHYEYSDTSCLHSPFCRHRLQSVPLCSKPPRIRRGFLNPADSVLPCSIWPGRFLFRSMPRAHHRHYQGHWR